MTRICMYPKDVEIITGKSNRYARNLINFIKNKLGKEKHQSITVKEFCNHLGLQETEVMTILK